MKKASSLGRQVVERLPMDAMKALLNYSLMPPPIALLAAAL
jgi:hypothetical protein